MTMPDASDYDDAEKDGFVQVMPDEHFASEPEPLDDPLDQADEMLDYHGD